MTRLSLLLFASTLAAAEPPVRYNRDVRPILSEHCFACHGADSAARKAKLRLDVREDAIEKGAIAPGKVSESEMIARIILKDDDEGLMPPLKSHKKLKPAQKEILKKWVEQGAEYQPHWAFIAPKPPAPMLNTDWSKRNKLDELIESSMQDRGLKPNPEADRRTLARRLSLDLIGLPPTIAEVESFVADKDQNWYEKYVDLLMAKPQWGEHRGRYWLDYARYADTHGIHFDNFREMWSYRDWVINAFNKNQKFDQFTIEQLAGDLLPNATLEQKIATGFNRCNITTNEGGIIDEEYLVLYTRDRTEAANVVFMGLTAGCAVCHDHKYDPISQKEFYSMAAFFNNSTQGAKDGNIQNTPPIMIVPRAEDKMRWDSLSQHLDSERKKLDARKTAARKDFDTWLKTASPKLAWGKIPSDAVFHAPLDESRGTEIITFTHGDANATLLTNGYSLVKDKDAGSMLALKLGKPVSFPDVGNFKANQPFSVSLGVKIAKRGYTGAILARMTEDKGFRGWDLWLENDRVGMHIISTYSAKAIKVVAKTPLDNKFAQVAATYDGSGKAGGVKIYINGVPQAVDVNADSLAKTDDITTKVPFALGQRNNSSRLENVNIEDVRLFDRALSAAEVDQIARADKAGELIVKAKRTPAENDALFDWYLRTFDNPYRDTTVAIAGLVAEEAAIKGRGTVAHVSAEKPGMPEAFLLNRGEYDQRRDKLSAALPKALPPMPEDYPKNRLGFAKWLLMKEHPLTARVTVNRFWQELFGQGLVRTAGDFGIAGELPSHPELLDYLALDFQKDWDVKRFFKLLVMSATYRQSAAASKEKIEKDPQNVWLSRGPRFRMDAEMVRDYALASSGLLVTKIGGPSVKPYQPEGVWEAVAMIGSNTRNYKRDDGESLYRRSLYTFWKRAAPPASMEVLNAPNRETCTVKRDRTNTPLQALLTLNDVQFVEAARELAENTMKAAKDDDERIDYLAKTLLARSFSEKERPVVRDSLAALKKEFQSNPDGAKKLVAFGEKKADTTLDPGTLAAWTMLANELMNLDEVLNK